MRQKRGRTHTRGVAGRALALRMAGRGLAAALGATVLLRGPAPAHAADGSGSSLGLTPARAADGPGSSLFPAPERAADEPGSSVELTPARAADGPGSSLGLELGRASAARLDVRIPSSTGTRFSMVDELSTDDATYVRIRAQALLADRHVVALTVAPLRFEASGATRRDVLFDRYLFPAGTDVRATYRFDSYRLTYRYALKPTERLRLAVGATAFVRDAEVRLESKWGTAISSNTGLVPLLSAELQWQLAPRFSLLVDGDALAAPQGRAVDVLVAGCYRAADRLDLHAGYRLLEGGADGDAVYTFALAHLWNVGATLRF